MRQILFLSLALFVVAACSSQKPEPKGNRKKIVLIPGHDSHGVGEHEHLGGCILLAELLNKNVPGVLAVVTEQGWPKDTTILDDADAIVMYSDGGESHMAIPHLAHLDRLMNKGVGLLNLHYAVEVPKGVVGDYFKKWVGGYFETDWSVNPFWVAKYTSFPRVPITNGVKPFETKDEWYYHMRFVDNDKNLVPILVALPPPSSLDRKDGPHEGNPAVRDAVINKKEPQVMAWAYTRANGGRGFGLTGAHVHDNWMNDDFRKLVLNAIVWTAQMAVPENGVSSATPTKARLDSLRKDPNHER
jgi:type 1 glutamine amidotransferase